jgi:hypothetical protein
MLKTVLAIMWSFWVLVPGELVAGDADHSLDRPGNAVDHALVTVITGVMTQAEALGMPSMSGAILYHGTLTALRGPSTYDSTDPMRLIQAKLSDGSWLIDLWDHAPAKEVDKGEIAALKPITPAGLAEPDLADSPGTAIWQNDVVRLARLIQAGSAAAPQVLVAAMHARTNGSSWYDNAVSPYPREPVGRTPEDLVRSACRWWFLDHLRLDPHNAHWGEAAIAIAPARCRAGTVSSVARLPAAQAFTKEVPEQASESVRLAHWIPTELCDFDSPVIRAISDDRLIALTGDTTTARLSRTEAGTVGDRVLGILGERWGVDPALCAGRDRNAPWDDAERAALSRALTAWWTATAGQPVVDRVVGAVSGMPMTEMPPVLGQRHVQRQMWHWYNQNRDQVGGTADGVPAPGAEDEDAFIHALGMAMAVRLASPSPSPSIEPTDIYALMAWFHDVPAFSACMEAYPRTGRLSVLMAAWDDAHGKPAGVDALVETWLQHPLEDEPFLKDREQRSGYEIDDARIHPPWSTPVVWWVANGSPSRWKRLKSILAGDLTAAATARLLAGCGQAGQVADLSAQTPANLSFALVCAALADQRPMTAELRARAVQMDQRRMRDLPSDARGDAPAEALQHAPPAGDLRVCDLALIQNLAFGVDLGEAQREDRSLSTACLASPVADRDRVIAMFVRKAYRQAGGGQHAGTRPSMKAAGRSGRLPRRRYQEGRSRSDSQRRASVCHQIVTQAQSRWAFPVLTRRRGGEPASSTVVPEGARGGDCICTLQDGTWLANGVVAFPARAGDVGGPGPHACQPRVEVNAAGLPAQCSTACPRRMPRTRFKDNAIIANAAQRCRRRRPRRPRAGGCRAVMPTAAASSLPASRRPPRSTSRPMSSGVRPAGVRIRCEGPSVSRRSRPSYAKPWRAGSATSWCWRHPPAMEIAGPRLRVLSWPPRTGRHGTI